MRDRKESARSRCSSSRAKGVHSHRDTEIISGGWTRAQCRTIGAVFVGWFAVMSILEVIF